jgi:hypothetical protein
MKSLESYGRSTFDRINRLFDELSEEEKTIYFRLESFVKIWGASVGGKFDQNEHTEFFKKTNMYALRQIDSVFFRKYGLHVESHAHQLEMNEIEWDNGLQPLSRWA